MGLDVPELDDRTYAALVEDARKRIPVFTDEWTDHNAHDPGITILEMLAWLAETYIYQLDQVTEAHVRKYLDLMGAKPVTPASATTHLALTLPAGTDGLTVPAGEPLVADDGSGLKAGFETLTGVALTRARVATVVSEHRGGTTDNSTVNAAADLHFLAFGADAEPGSRMYLGLDGDPFPDGVDRLDLTVDLYEADLPDPASHGDEESPLEPSVRVAWEYCTDYDAWYDDDAWAGFAVEEDGTLEFYRSGRVRLAKPADWLDEERAILGLPTPRRWLRCVVRERERDPASPDTGHRVCADEPRPWTLQRRVADTGPQRHEIPPRVEAVGLNVVEVGHRTTVETTTDLRPKDAATSTSERTSARPNQTFVFPNAPVRAATVGVVDPDSGEGSDEPWTPVDDFDDSGPDDRHYVLDATTGEVRFGDGRRGRIPDAGQVVRSPRYVHGGGTEGNLPVTATFTFIDAPGGEDGVVARALRSATGGREAVSVQETLAELKEDMKRPYRAVTADDYVTVATSTPGLRFGRATARVESQDPETVGQCGPRHETRVVVVPYSTRDEPRPSRGFLEAVQCHLCEHVLLTDHVTVEPPSFVEVRVRATVGLEPGYTTAGRTEAVAEAIDAFVHPLSGFEGDGWPFGRPLYVSEVYDVVSGVEGVDCVLDVDLDASGRYTVASDGSIEIGETALLVAGDHSIAVRDDRAQCVEER